MKKKICQVLLCGIVLLGLCGCGNKEKTDIPQTNDRDENVKQIEVMTEYINIREKRDVSSNVLGKVYKGEIYTIISEDVESVYHWFEIETTNGIKGFISGKDDYVKVLEITSINEDAEESIEEEKEENVSNNINSNSNNNNNNNGNSINDNTNSNNSNSNNSNGGSINDNTNNNLNNSGGISTNDNTNSDDLINNSTSNKKVISATKEAYCSEGTMQYKNGRPSYCIKEYWEDSYVVVGCSDGYTLSASEDKCEKGEDRPSLKPANSPYCSDGSQVIYESVSGTFSCRTGTLITQRCPDGYKWVSDRINGINIDLCMWKDYYKTTNKITSCTKGKYYSSRNSCLVTDIVSLSYKYICQAGYTLKDDKCYEN